MALNSLNSQGLSPIQPATEAVRGSTPKSVGPAAGAEFRSALDQVSRGKIESALGNGMPSAIPAAQTAAPLASQLKFSAHAIDRMRSRGISFAPDMMKNIEGAIQKAAQKGSKDTLVLAGDNALIVSVKNNTVVTVMDRAAMKENVFTNIDSTVVI